MQENHKRNFDIIRCDQVPVMTFSASSLWNKKAWVLQGLEDTLGIILGGNLLDVCQALRPITLQRRLPIGSVILKQEVQQQSTGFRRRCKLVNELTDLRPCHIVVRIVGPLRLDTQPYSQSAIGEVTVFAGVDLQDCCSAGMFATFPPVAFPFATAGAPRGWRVKTRVTFGALAMLRRMVCSSSYRAASGLTDNAPTSCLVMSLCQRGERRHQATWSLYVLADTSDRSNLRHIQ